MKKSRFTETQIVAILAESAAGRKTADLCRTHGMSAATLAKWKSKFAGLAANEAIRLRVLEAENRRLRKLVADQAHNIEALKIIAAGKF